VVVLLVGDGREVVGRAGPGPEVLGEPSALVVGRTVLDVVEAVVVVAAPCDVVGGGGALGKWGAQAATDSAAIPTPEATNAACQLGGLDLNCWWVLRIGRRHRSTRAGVTPLGPPAAL